MQSVEFLYPIAFLLLPLYLFLVWFVKKYYRRVGFSNVKLLKKALHKSFDYSKILKLAIITLLASSLATPVTKENIQEKSKKGYDISLLVDASDSMQEEHRFTVAKEIVANFIKQRKSDNIALTLFANYAYVASPLTYEKESLLKMLQYLKLGVAGSRDTALYEALFLGADLFKKSSRKNRVMILLTDGLNTVKSVSLQSALERIKQNRIKVYTIALGKKGDYNKKVLEEIAKSSGGEFYQALQPEELALIYSQINQLEATKIEGKNKTLYTHYFYYPLILALILILIYGTLYYGSYNRLFFLLAVLFVLIALYRPSSNQKGTSPKKSGSFGIAIDLSYAMDAKDIYPNRLAFTKAKIKSLLKQLSGQKVALYAYAKGGFLITPATNDYERLRYLVENLEPVGIERDRADLKSLLKSVTTVGTQKSILLFSATDDKYDPSAITYATEHNLKIYLYGVATKVGTVVKEDGHTLLRNGQIDIFRLNKTLESLAGKTGGSYWHYSLGDDINNILDKIETKQEQREDSKSQKELFFIPLTVAIALFFLALFSRRFR